VGYHDELKRMAHLSQVRQDGAPRDALPLWGESRPLPVRGAGGAGRGPSSGHSPQASPPASTFWGGAWKCPHTPHCGSRRGCWLLSELEWGRVQKQREGRGDQG